MRVAIYFTPPAGAELTRAASLWLGRNAFDGEATRERDERIDPLVAAPARYGFHATIKAPFRLAPGAELADVDARLAAFCASRPPIVIPRVEIARLGRFFAIVPDPAPPSLFELEAEVVRAFEPFRAETSEAEIARRAGQDLSDRQKTYLETYGYPHVFEDFRFHMTLTGPIEGANRDEVAAMLGERLGEHHGKPLAIDALSLFVEPEPGAPFKLHSFHPFQGS